MLFFGGCYLFQTSRQKQWHQDFVSLEARVIGSEGRCARIMSEQELAAHVGSPDGIVSPPELYRLLQQTDQAYASEALSNLWERYAKVKSDLGSDLTIHSNTGWQSCTAFEAGSLWVYDESKHFNKPIVWGWDTRTGFAAPVFYMEEGHVLFTWTFAWWPQIEYPPFTE